MMFGWYLIGPSCISSKAMSYSYVILSKLRWVTTFLILRSTWASGSLVFRTWYSPILTSRLLGRISLTQWAAVMIQRLVRSAAPHLCLNCPLLYCLRETVHGHSA